MLDLSGVNAKIARAEYHAQTVDSEIVSWFNESPFSTVHDFNADFTRHAMILRIRKAGDFERWALMIGDAIHNLRCALDHMVYAIAVHKSGLNPPPFFASLQFPICDEPAVYPTESGRRLKGLCNSVRAAIELAQPYNRPHKDLPPLLGLLRDLDNTDKHRLLHLATTNVSKWEIGMKRKDGRAFDGPTFQELPTNSEVKDGTQITAFIFKSPTPDMEFDNCRLKVIVTLGHRVSSMGYDRSSFDTILRDLTAEVREVVDLVCSKI